jgi:phosphatidylglycerol lysyltransferase
VRTLADDVARYVSLGLAPLALARVPHRAWDTPFWLRPLFAWMRAHGRRFYNFGGLEAFKAKFEPHRWEPIYAIYNRPRVSPRAVYAIAAAFTGGWPVAVFAKGLGWAARRELHEHLEPPR